MEFSFQGGLACGLSGELGFMASHYGCLPLPVNCGRLSYFESRFPPSYIFLSTAGLGDGFFLAFWERLFQGMTLRPCLVHLRI